jgi:hypothetical protein
MNTDSVPTYFGGHRMRSRLEADWAASLSSLGVKWEYEPQLVTLPSGVRYLPDFWLPEIGTWVEVKGAGVPGAEKAEEFARQIACPCTGACSCRWPGGEIVLIGRDPVPDEDRSSPGTMKWECAHASALLGECDQCGAMSWRPLAFAGVCRKCGVLDKHYRGPLLGQGDVKFHRAYRPHEHLTGLTPPQELADDPIAERKWINEHLARLPAAGRRQALETGR